MFRTAIALIWIASSAAAVRAASVVVLQGEALVSHGEGYERVTSERALAVGDMVLADSGSVVKVKFSKACSIFLGTGALFSVPAEPPCQTSGESNNVTTGATTDTAPSPTQDWTSATQTTFAVDTNQTNVWPYLAGAAAVGGAAIAIAAFSGSGGSETPASP